MDQDVVNGAKAFMQVESGGDFNAKGKSGEHGVAQWLPNTWKSQAKTILGDANAPMTPENQKAVLYVSLKKDKDAGLSLGQSAAKWNSGSPNGWEHKVGVNNKGVEYNVPQYVKRITETYRQIKGGANAEGYQTTASLPDATGVPENQDKGFLGNVVSDVSNRIGQASSAIGNTLSGKINLASGALQTGGAFAGGVGDIGMDVLGAITPDFIKKPLTAGVQGLVGAAANTPLGQAAIKGATDFAQAHPELSADIGAVGNIASLIPIGRGIGIAGKVAGEALPTATKAVAGTSGILGDLAKKRLVNDALEVVAPKETAKTIKQGVKSGRGVIGGMLKSTGVAPNPQTIRAAEAAAGIVRKGKTAVENANAVKDEIGNVAEKLKSDLKKMDITPIISQDDLNGLYQRTSARLAEDPTMVGDAGESAARILNKFRTYLPKTGDITASDVLDARKKLDSWIGGLSGGGSVFDPAYENAKSIALRAVRQEANSLIAEKAPSVAVKDMLSRQSALYDALENIAAKAPKEMGTNKLQRLAARHPLITQGVKYGTGAFLGGLGLGEAQNLLGK